MNTVRQMPKKNDSQSQESETGLRRIHDRAEAAAGELIAAAIAEKPSKTIVADREEGGMVCEIKVGPKLEQTTVRAYKSTASMLRQLAQIKETTVHDLIDKYIKDVLTHDLIVASEANVTELRSQRK